MALMNNVKREPHFWSLTVLIVTFSKLVGNCWIAWTEHATIHPAVSIKVRCCVIDFLLKVYFFIIWSLFQSTWIMNTEWLYRAKLKFNLLMVDRFQYRRTFAGSYWVPGQWWWISWCAILPRGSGWICCPHHVRQRRHSQVSLHGSNPAQIELLPG